MLVEEAALIIISWRPSQMSFACVQLSGLLNCSSAKSSQPSGYPQAECFGSIIFGSWVERVKLAPFYSLVDTS